MDFVVMCDLFQEHLYELETEQGIKGEILYSLSTDTNNMWRINAVSVENQRFESRLKLHKDWLALRDDELVKASGIEGATFVHAAGFTGGNKTRDGALKMAELSIDAAV